jgi:hypothetical protein
MGKIPNIFLYNRLFILFLFFIDSELLNFSKSRLTKIFKNGMELAYSNRIIRYDTIDESELYNIDKKYLDDSNYKEIDNFRKDIQHRTKEDWLKNKSIKLFEIFDSNIDEFIEQINSNESDQLIWKPCFKFIDPTNLFSKIIKLNNDDLIKFREAIFSRYSIKDKERDIEERNTFCSLKDKLDSYVKEKGENFRLSNYIIKAIISELENICNNNT